MIAENNEYMKEASKTIFQLSADELVRKRCQDREEYYDDIRSYQHAIEKRDATIEEKDHTIKEQGNTIKKQDNTIKEQSITISQKDSENARLRQKLIEAGINPDE